VEVRDAMPGAFQLIAAEEDGLPASYDPTSGRWFLDFMTMGESRTLKLRTYALTGGT
jgi:hypothetical protein